MARVLVLSATFTSILSPSYPARLPSGQDSCPCGAAVGAQIKDQKIFFEVCGEDFNIVVCHYRKKAHIGDWTEFSNYEKAVFQGDRWVCPFWPPNPPDWDIRVTRNGWSQYTSEQEAVSRGRLDCQTPAPTPTLPPTLPPSGPPSVPPRGPPREPGTCVPFWDSKTMKNQTSFWSECGNIPETATAIRIVMGDTKDYFRPRAPATLCEMLSSHELHEWSPDGHAWEVPVYYHGCCLFGGSLINWPKENSKYPDDQRDYLPFWNWYDGRLGCCHNSYKGEHHAWGKHFTMEMC